MRKMRGKIFLKLRRVSLGTATVAKTLSWITVQIKMDFFQHRYYRLGKILMCLTGTWPYQSMRARCGIVAVLIVLTAYQVGGQIVAVVTYRHDPNILLECLIPNVFDAVCVAKYLAYVRNTPNIKKLLDRIRMDWVVWARHKEVKFLHEYAEQGEKMTILLTVVVFYITFFYMMHPIISKVIDIVLKNGTAPRVFAIPIIYRHLDEQKYYYYLIAYGVVCAFVFLTAVLSCEVWLIIYGQQACGIFAAVGHKLECIGNHDTLTKTRESPYALEEMNRMYLAYCIDRHNDAIEYANLVKACFVWHYFFTIGFGMILLNAIGLQMILRTNNLGEILTFTALTLGVGFIFYVECSVSQLLIDQSISIRFYIHNSKWYKLSAKTQKILQLMTMRCNLPCHLTAGNMLVISIESFGLLLRTAMSYFAFMRSMQRIST